MHPNVRGAASERQSRRAVVLWGQVRLQFVATGSCTANLLRQPPSKGPHSQRKPFGLAFFNGAQDERPVSGLRSSPLGWWYEPAPGDRGCRTARHASTPARDRGGERGAGRELAATAPLRRCGSGDSARPARVDSKCCWERDLLDHLVWLMLPTRRAEPTTRSRSRSGSFPAVCSLAPAHRRSRREETERHKSHVSVLDSYRGWQTSSG
jgi:hypothetical protein